jgi:hypothetical protein
MTASHGAGSRGAGWRGAGWHRTGWRGAALAVAIAALIAGCTSATSPTQTTPPPSPQPTGSVSTGTHWMLAASGVTLLEQAGGTALVKRYLDGPQTTILTSSTIPANLARWNVTFALDTRSLAEISSGLSGLSSRITMILYDPEDWSYTPLSEQTAVGEATRQAASLAHGAGRELIVAPATNLAQVTDPGVAAAPAFISSDDLGKVAPSANWVEIQAQGLERNSARYSAYISQAVGQIRAANPNAVIYAGLSTNPSGGPVTAAELLSDVSATSSQVTGYWLNVPVPGAACPACGQPQPQIGLDLLEGLADGQAGS